MNKRKMGQRYDANEIQYSIYEYFITVYCMYSYEEFVRNE